MHGELKLQLENIVFVSYALVSHMQAFASI